jgi:hypothetical protein
MDLIEIYTNKGIEPVPSSVIHAGIIPYTFSNNQMLFLLGKEHYETDWRSALKYGPFGGSPERYDKSAQDAAAREGYEESMGFLGKKNEIYERIINTNKVYRSKKAIIYPIQIYYEPLLPKRFEDVYGYLNKCMRYTKTKKPYIPSCPNGYLEKISVDYFTVDRIIKENSSMRTEWYEFFLQVILRDKFVLQYASPKYRKYINFEQGKLDKKKRIFY